MQKSQRRHWPESLTEHGRKPPGCRRFWWAVGPWRPDGILRRHKVSPLAVLAIAVAIPIAATAQSPDALDWQGKLQFHGEALYSPASILGFAAYSAILQELNAPAEWGQGAAGYGRRFASTVGGSAIHSALAFGLDTTLRQDPRYHRLGRTGIWRRAGHAFRQTILTRTDTGGETFSTWRLGSAYGSAFISNLWYPDRLNTVRLGFIQGSVTVGFGLVSNLGAEFWSDIKGKVFRRNVGP